MNRGQEAVVSFPQAGCQGLMGDCRAALGATRGLRVTSEREQVGRTANEVCFMVEGGPPQSEYVYL